MEMCVPLGAVIVALLALQSSFVCGSPAKRHDDAWTVTTEEGYYEEQEYFADYDGKRDVADDLRENTVKLMSLQTGRFIYTTGNVLSSNGKTAADPSVKFMLDDVSHNTISLSQDQQLLGIHSNGQILMDPSNSPNIAHEFEVVRIGPHYDDRDSGVVQLRVTFHGRYCYLAFTAEGHSVADACAVQSQSPETFLSILHT